MGASPKTVPKPQERAFLFKAAAFEDMNLLFASQGFIMSRIISEVCHSGCFCFLEVEAKKGSQCEKISFALDSMVASWRSWLLILYTSVPLVASIV